jgi:cytochrome o ubiquinol oxidase subunit 3
MSTHASHLHLDHHHQHEQEVSTKVTFGFWIYIMSDCILFSMLFATYAVLHNNTFGSVTGKDIFDMPYVLIETFILLTSSFTYGLVMLSAHANKKNQVMFWLMVTFLLGLSFVCMEVKEFHHLISEGHGPNTSAFLSSFFTSCVVAAS